MWRDFLFNTVVLLGGLFSSYGQNDPAAVKLLLNAQEILAAQNFFTYTGSYRVKLFDSRDTTKTETYACIVSRQKTDTILGYYIKQANQTEERIYDGINCYIIFHPEKKMITDLPALSGKKFVRNNIKRDVVPDFFYSKKMISYLLEAADSVKLGGTALVAGNPCRKVELTMPVNEEVTFMKMIFFIDEASGIPVKKLSYATYMGIQDEYQELTISGFTMSTEENVDFTSLYHYPSAYQAEEYRDINRDYSMLPAGTPVIPFKLPGLDGKEYNISEMKSTRLILLDFWYMACAPCLKKMPEIEKLYDLYKNKGLLVLGMNSFDADTARRSQLNKMLGKLEISYPIVFCDKSLEKVFKISSYPSVYLIENGKIIYSHAGIEPEKMDTLRKLIIGKLE